MPAHREADAKFGDRGTVVVEFDQAQATPIPARSTAALGPALDKLTRERHA
jgi:hypothetical protein